MQMEREWVSDCGTVRLICGDCLEVLPTLEAGSVDAVVTDPPYGIGEDGGACRTRGKPGYAKHEHLGWDGERPEWIAELLNYGDNQIIWGGNYFADLLPPSMGWLYWRKLMGGDFSDGELAWTSRQKALREYVKCPKGMDKSHPCEKPVELMVWCIGFVPNANTILDPFMGSGTTGVACVRTGRKFIGIEKEPKYFKIAKRRIIDELNRFPLLEQKQAPQQLELAGGDE